MVLVKIIQTRAGLAKDLMSDMAMYLEVCLDRETGQSIARSRQQSLQLRVVGDSGEGERSFRREGEQHSGLKVNVIGA